MVRRRPLATHASAPPQRRPLRLGLLLAALAPSSSAYHSAASCAGCGQQRQQQRTAAAPRAVLEVGQPAFSPQEPAAAADPASAGTVGVLLLNLGGPDTLDNVEPFLYNLFSDPEIITLPDFLQWMNGPLAWYIAKSRAPQSREGYKIVEKACGMVSPQLTTTEKQGHGIVEALAKKGVNAKSYVAMRYWYPFTEDALQSIKQDGIERLVVLPLYPQFSISTSGSSLRLLEREFYQDQALRQIRNVVIPAWYNREGYVNACARLIASKLDLASDKTSPHLFFSAHGVPVKYIEALADPYQKQTEATVGFIMNALRRRGYTNEHTLAYQSKVGPVEWLQPSTDDKIRELGAAGVEKLVVVPISFVSEHIETLEEIDGEYRELAEENGIEWWERVPALGVEDDFIDDLADAVMEVLPNMNEPPKSDINEGRPVSLRVVNDLVQLRGKEEDIEYGPVRYEVRRTGFTPNAELINGRIAMLAISVASVYAAIDGELVADVLDGRIPKFFL